MGYYPLMLDVSRYPVVLVGGGSLAQQKLGSLIEADARLTVVAPSLQPAMAEAMEAAAVRWVPRLAVDQDFQDARLVIAASDDPQYNRLVAAMARAQGAWVNAVDDLPSCDVVAASHFRRGPLLLSISSSGQAPVVAKALRERLEELVGNEWRTLLDQVSAVRSQLRGEDLAFDERRQRLADLTHALLPPLFQTHPLQPGTVYIVGAGPGHAELLTLAAFKAIRQADIVFYDRLVHESVLSSISHDAELVDVGKTPGQPSPSQDQINQLLVQSAEAGKRVVRLHGGDPFIFGRAGEEIRTLNEAGIRFAVLPGLSSALTAPALAGIPLTLRGVSDEVAIVNAHPSAREDVHWRWFSQFSGTLVLLMGMARLSSVVEALRAAGRSPSTPCAVIAWAGWDQQQVLRAPLDDLATQVATSGLGSPAVIVVGRVAEFEQDLAPSR